MSQLATPYNLKQLHLKNRIVMAPMCQYSVAAKDGAPNDWHYVHYVSRAVGGAGLILMEMTDVEPDGRITDYDLGLWSDDQIPSFERIITEVKKYGAKIGIQIAHAGRKAKDANTPVAPSAIQMPQHPMPRALSTEEVQEMVEKFRRATERAIKAGVDTIELHGAHGYLLHQFHSPLTNQRQDIYGQSLTRFGVEVIQAMKSVMPPSMPLLMRISGVEYVEGGYDLNHAIQVCKDYQEAGVDIFHITSGGEAPVPHNRKPRSFPGYQVPYARRMKEALQTPVIAVGNLDEPRLAEATLANGDADLVSIGRGMLIDPYWAIHAIQTVDGEADKNHIPRQYQVAY